MRIAEAAEKYGISADTLRYYERAGLLPHVHRSESGVRDYSEEDCARIEFVKCLRSANVSIEALARYMRLMERGDETIEERKAILVEQREEARARLAELQAGLDRLDYKIAHYDELIAHAGGRPKA
ncbi:MAG: MerR family transcriptional regulator [Coriobacteriia bacterium]|nr:MerR family transcriptional regulator [Coriobacteriia bacterium]MBS5478185.1 MerR family transcriptional regulator [Coriobacteriia bacterium]